MRYGPLPYGAPLEQRPENGSLRRRGRLSRAPYVRLLPFPGGYFFSRGPICPPRSLKPCLRPGPKRVGREGATHGPRGGSGALGGDQAAAYRPGPPSPLLLTTARPPRPGFPPPPDAGLTRILRLISVPISMAPWRAMSSALHVASLTRSPEPAHSSQPRDSHNHRHSWLLALRDPPPPSRRAGARRVRLRLRLRAPGLVAPALRRPLPAAGRAGALGLGFAFPLWAPAELFILSFPLPHLLILSPLENTDELNVQR